MLDDYNPNIADLVPCLIEEALKEFYDTTMDVATPEELNNAKDYVFKKGSAILLLIGADHGYYGPMKNQMQQNMAMVSNNHAKFVNETMNILNMFAKTIKRTYQKKSESQGQRDRSGFCSD